MSHLKPFVKIALKMNSVFWGFFFSCPKLYSQTQVKKHRVPGVTTRLTVCPIFKNNWACVTGGIAAVRTVPLHAQ